MPMEELIMILVLPVAGMTAGVVVLLAALRYRARTLELVHQERMAMIERGVTPPAASALVGQGSRFDAGAATRGRAFSLGIIVIGIGLAFMMLIGVAGESPNAAIGVGGAIAILGAAFIVRSLLSGHGSPAPSGPAGPGASAAPQPSYTPAAPIPPAPPPPVPDHPSERD